MELINIGGIPLQELGEGALLFLTTGRPGERVPMTARSGAREISTVIELANDDPNTN
jgi:hypothetical protein